jgi:hypothetical protein
MDDEHRANPRRRLLKTGLIAFGGGTISCTVRNLSEDGAALDVTSPLGIPAEFNLVMSPGQINVPCRVVWRKGTRLGVHFET